MSTPVRIKRHLDSETVYLPELRELVGRDVEIVVRELPAEIGRGANGRPLQGSVLKYDDPLEPVSEGDWEALA